MVESTSKSADGIVRAALEEQFLRTAADRGGRLPAERVLAETLGCTRAQVRRVLDQLEHEGRVSRQVGRGTFVRTGPMPGPADGSFTPAAIMTASSLFEPEVVSLAALAATEEDFAELRICLERGAAATDYESFEQWDISLHRAFAVATHNQQIVAMVDVLNSTRNNPVWGRLKHDGFTPENRAIIEREHHEIVAALCERDRRRAAGAMTDHLRFVRRIVMGNGS